MKNINYLIKQLEKNKKKIKFILIGGLNTMFGLAIYPFLLWILKSFKIHYLIILLFCQFISITFAYFMYKLFVFRTKGNYLREFLKFSSFYLSILLINLIALPILVEGFNIPIVLSQIIFTFVVIVLSYFWHSKISFLDNY